MKRLKALHDRAPSDNLKITPFMAKIYPFRAYRYSSSAGAPVSLVTQPYDKITPKMREAYLAQSPYNLVRIILGKSTDADSPSDNVYTRAAKYLTDWIETGVLAQEKEPSLYAYFQEFRVPDTGEYLVRKAVSSDWAK